MQRNNRNWLNMKYTKKLKSLISKTNRNIRPASALILVYDILFYVFAYIGIKKYISAVKNSIMLLQSPDLFSFVNDPSKFNIEASYAVLQKFYGQLIGYTFLIIVFLIIIWSLSRYFIWQNITKKKFSLKSLLKLMPTNALWLIIVFIPLIILFIPFYSYVKMYGQVTTLPLGLSVLKIILLLVVFLVFYFTDIMHLLFLKTNKCFSSMYQAFKAGTLKAYPMLAGYALVFALIYICNSLFKNLGTFGGILELLIILISFTWIKMFFNVGIEK